MLSLQTQIITKKNKIQGTIKNAVEGIRDDEELNGYREITYAVGRVGKKKPKADKQPNPQE